MVAPTRTPQARGVKCELCKKILSLTTWLDQTKLAKDVKEPEIVLSLIADHDKSGCLCIPRNIQNLICGSTHFEIHRLLIASVDMQVHGKQIEHTNEIRSRAVKDKKRYEGLINDCNEVEKASRFQIYDGSTDLEVISNTKTQLHHLKKAISYWKIAFEDETSPFNSKLALRLGLTHHVIYACYLFKFYKLLEAQLTTAHLLLDLFKSIEGVTTHAILHANFLLIKSLLDLNQFQEARHYLKQAKELFSSSGPAHYESILLKSIDVEMALLDCHEPHERIDELASLAVIKPNDKLQHYYARSVAMNLILKYIQYHTTRSDCCFEFYHSFRYLSAIIRRCYDSSFDLILHAKNPQYSSAQETSTNLDQVSNHSWVKFAVCDLSFTTFELLSKFFIRTGQPECLELVYKGLNLVSFRTGSAYWQFKLLEIGSLLDSLCDRYEESNDKVEKLENYLKHYNSSDENMDDDLYLKGIFRIIKEVCLALVNRGSKTLQVNEIRHLLSWIAELCLPENYRSNKGSGNLKNSKTANKYVIPFDLLDHSYLSLTVLKIATYNLFQNTTTKEATAMTREYSFIQKLLMSIPTQLDCCNRKLLTYEHQQVLLEILLCFAGIHKSSNILIETISNSDLFLRADQDIETKFSNLTINSDTIKRDQKWSKSGGITKANSKRTRKKGSYDVVSNSKHNIPHHQLFDEDDYSILNTLIDLNSATDDRLILTYLRNTEPNPDYLLYRKAHELLFSLSLKGSNTSMEHLLFHFCESSTSNTLRYRWMMSEEPHASLYDETESFQSWKPQVNPKSLSFCNSTVEISTFIRYLRRSIPNDQRLLQVKFIPNKRSEEEHIVMASYDSTSEPIFAHVKRSTAEEDDLMGQFCDKISTRCDSSIPLRLRLKIEEAKKTLFLKSHVTRLEKRKILETELAVILYDFENEFLGSFRFLFCPKTTDLDYAKMVGEVKLAIHSIMGNHVCKSEVGLELMLSNAPLLNRQEFIDALSSLYGHPKDIQLGREAFNKWTRSMEIFQSERETVVDKMTFLRKLSRGQLGLILDQELDHVPFESMPVIRQSQHGMFRVPSLRLYHTLVTSHQSQGVVRIDLKSAFYLLDPADNLQRTRERFEAKLGNQKSWKGWVGKSPATSQLERMFSERQLYLFIGHGAGTTYYNQLRKGRGMSSMAQIKPVSIVMGCSSGRTVSEGPRLESYGINWVFVMRGSPAYVGLLWDVTDTDIDKFLDSLLEDLLTNKWNPSRTKGDKSRADDDSCCLLTEAISRARQACQLKLLVGATPVVYGLPVSCKA